jgi:homoserine O-acetyltransferase
LHTPHGNAHHSFSTVAEIHNLALTTPSYRVRETPANKFEEFVEAVDKDGLGRTDANDWLRQLQAMMAHNIASPFNDSFEAAAKQVKAKFMVVAATQDHMMNPTPAMEFAGILHADGLASSVTRAGISILCGDKQYHK